MIELVAFLGNYGREYERNRHNAGRLLERSIPFLENLAWQKKCKGRYAAMDMDRLCQTAGAKTAVPPEAPKRLHFIMPETYMNLSGDSVHEAATFFKIPAEKILVVHDELEIPLGFASFKFSGGLGGHNGLRSMKARFGTPDFWRLRIGIGRPNHADIAAWVLSDFTKEEFALLDTVFPLLAEVFADALLYGPDKLLPDWNKRKIV
ncbi:MAG: aminoacyl-tRNA hydrolase [Treponemataceae bacterium]